MLTRRHIMELIPHQGTMCLLDGVLAWSAEGITCAASSNLSPDNPLRRDGRLGAVCGIEYGLQAAALHAALMRDEAARSAGAAPDQPGNLAFAVRADASIDGTSAPADAAGCATIMARTAMPQATMPQAATPSAGSPSGIAGVHRQSPGYLAALRGVELHVERLDDASFGTLRVIAHPELRAAGGLIYRFAVETDSAKLLLCGQATIVFAASAA